MNVNGFVKDKHYMLSRLSVWFCISKRDWMSIKAHFLIHKKITVFCSIFCCLQSCGPQWPSFQRASMDAGRAFE